MIWPVVSSPYSPGRFRSNRGTVHTANVSPKIHTVQASHMMLTICQNVSIVWERCPGLMRS